MIDYSIYTQKGIDYSTYLNDFENDLNSGDSNPYHKYLPMNWQRVTRLNKSLTVDSETQHILQTAPKQTWLVITEHWCGDASQIVPVLAKLAESAPENIDLKLVYRDQNLELIDAHLTNNGRAIPKLVILNANQELMAEWGPRPQQAQALVKELKSNPATADTYADELHKWYAKDKQASIIKEVLEVACAKQPSI